MAIVLLQAKTERVSNLVSAVDSFGSHLIELWAVVDCCSVSEWLMMERSGLSEPLQQLVRA